jgi:hypothetical protein
VVPSIHSREPSVTRGRALTTSTRAGSPRSHTPIGAVPKPNSSPDGGIERKTSLSYGHHRQTSIVHGMQHSRNTSFVNSPATSPLSPQVLTGGAASSLPFDGSTMILDETRELGLTGSTIVNGTRGHGNQGSVQIGGTSVEASSPGHRRPERMVSGRGGKRDHARSQSRHQHHQQEVRTVGEYALHHLFNAVSGTPLYCGEIITLTSKVVCDTGRRQDYPVRQTSE